MPSLLLIIALFHLWWKENLVQHQKVSKYYENECRLILVCWILWWSSLFVPLDSKYILQANLLKKSYLFTLKLCNYTLSHMLISMVMFRIFYTCNNATFSDFHVTYSHFHATFNRQLLSQSTPSWMLQQPYIRIWSMYFIACYSPHSMQ